MDKPTSIERINHILNAIRAIQNFMLDVDEESFLNDIEKQSAVQFQFLIIGEAIKHIDISFLNNYKYPWHIPRSFRNFIIHEYHGIQMNRIYYAANDLFELEAVLNTMLHDFSKAD
ncbi:MAG: HepT-like ribonuclease domain-containing protein [Chitinophagaceae bacterium]